MIKSNEPLSMAEALEYIKDEEKGAEVIAFIKKFSKLNPKKAKELRQEIISLDIIKIMPEHIVKIIDILPETPEELNKIFVDLSLDEDETKKILEKIKSFK